MLLNTIKKIFKNKTNPSEFHRNINKICLEASQITIPRTDRAAMKILYGPSFNIYLPCYAHDIIFTSALRLRGAEIIPIYCDSIQQIECNYYGGVWGGNNFAEKCFSCCETSMNMWKKVNLTPLAFSRYLNKEEVRRIETIVASLPDNSWLSYTEDELAFGQWSKDILVNNYVVADHRLIEEHERLGRVHLRNLLIVRAVYAQILDQVKPDRVVANDSYYGMWAILQKMCEQRKIPFYSQWSGTRQGAWCYAHNDAAMNLNYKKAWPAFSAPPLKESQRTIIQEWLADRVTGKDMMLDTASLASHCKDEVDLSKIIHNKPTALLTANVIWDLAALNKQLIFEDMIEWISKTISWFGDHPQYQLIVKPHPGEQNPAIPETGEMVVTALRQRGTIIPKNVLLLTPKSAITVYQLIPLAKVGLMHTTNVGVEMAARGIPVITTASSPYRNFGFTLDPSTQDEYFQNITKILEGNLLLEKEKQIDLAYKFILFQQFHYYSKNDIMDFKFGEQPCLKVTSLNDIQPGKKPHLDYVADSVIAALPIVSENRWPAKS